MELTQEQDRSLRDYAKWLSFELGEDAYHTVICDIIRLGKENSIRSVEGYFRRAIKYSLYHMFRHEESEKKNIQAFINNDPIPLMKGFVPGGKPMTTCRKGHSWHFDMIVYVGNRRTCGICKKKREAEYWRKRKGSI